MKGNLDLIEGKIRKIYERIDRNILVEEEDRFPEIENLKKEVQDLVDYIRKGRTKWAEEIVEVLGYLREKIKAEMSQTEDTIKKEKLEKINNSIFGMIEGIKKEFLYNPEVVMERLKYDGNRVRERYPKVAEDINKIAFRLLEKIRLGQRDEVMYLLLRTFKADDKQLPDSLIEILKITKYDDSLFRSFMYAFLTPILGKESQTEGGES